MERFDKPGWTEHLFNRLLTLLTNWGVGPSYMYMLEVRGRKSGRRLRTPVNVMSFRDERYVVAPRGATQWVRNVRAAGEVVVRRGSSAETCRASELVDADKPPVLKEYLARYSKATGHYFPVTAESDLSEFAAVAPDYPVIVLHTVAD